LILGTSAATFALLNAQPATAKLQGKTGGIPIENFRDLPGTNPPIKYYDIKGGGSDSAVPFPKGTRVAVHYDLKFRSLTIASSRVGAGVTGGNPYGFNVDTPAASPGGPFIPAFNYGIQGMGVGTVRRMLVPAEYAYGNNQVQEIPPNSEVTLDLELLSIAKTGLSK
jgi:FKBP-type peptidyl-prolyl cis-trans isomerase